MVMRSVQKVLRSMPPNGLQFQYPSGRISLGFARRQDVLSDSYRISFEYVVNKLARFSLNAMDFSGLLRRTQSAVSILRFLNQTKFNELLTFLNDAARGIEGISPSRVMCIILPNLEVIRDFDFSSINPSDLILHFKDGVLNLDNAMVII